MQWPTHKRNWWTSKQTNQRTNEKGIDNKQQPIRLWSYNNIYTTKRALTSRHRKKTQAARIQIGTSLVVLLSLFCAKCTFVLLTVWFYESACIKYPTNYRNTWKKNPIIKLIWFLVTYTHSHKKGRLFSFIFGQITHSIRNISWIQEQSYHHRRSYLHWK